MRRFGPKPADTFFGLCPICGRPFQAGDYTTLIATAPADEEEAEKMRAGRVYNALAAEVCWDHAAHISALTGEAVISPAEEAETHAEAQWQEH